MAAMDIAGDEGDLESLKLVCSSHYTPALKKWGGILVYICPWFRLSFRPSFRDSVTLFRQRYLHNRLR